MPFRYLRRSTRRRTPRRSYTKYVKKTYKKYKPVYKKKSPARKVYRPKRKNPFSYVSEFYGPRVSYR